LETKGTLKRRLLLPVFLRNWVISFVTLFGSGLFGLKGFKGSFSNPVAKEVLGPIKFGN